MRAKVVFFDSNPIGRILTRFSKDMAVLDTQIPAIVVLVSYGQFRTFSVLISLVIVNPWLLIPLLICLYLFYRVILKTKDTMLEAQRLDGIVRGPVHSLFAMTVNGLVSIRAYNQVNFFRDQFLNESELCANVSFTYVLANRMLGFRFDIIMVTLIIVASIWCILLRDYVETEFLTFSLQILTDLGIFFSISIRYAVEM